MSQLGVVQLRHSLFSILWFGFGEASAYGDVMRILDFADDDDAVEASDAVNVAQGVEHEVLVVLHIVGIDFDLKVVVASGVVAFRNLVDALHGIHELLDEVVGVLLQSDVAEHDDIVPHLVMIHDGTISLDVSLSLQAFLTLEGWRRG